MSIIKLLKIEMWRMIRSKNVIFYLLAEMLAIMLPTLDNIEDVYLPLTDIFLTQYMGISLTIRYIYVAVIIGNLFSNDIGSGIIDTYIAVGAKRAHIVISKLLCAWATIILTVVLASLTYVIVSFLINGISYIPPSFYITILLSFIPLFVHTILLTCIDLLILLPMVTVFCSVFLVISVGLLPYDVAKWFYILYNNPISFFLYEETVEVAKMVLVVLTTGVCCAISSFLITCFKE